MALCSLDGTKSFKIETIFKGIMGTVVSLEANVALGGGRVGRHERLIKLLFSQKLTSSSFLMKPNCYTLNI